MTKRAELTSNSSKSCNQQAIKAKSNLRLFLLQHVNLFLLQFVTLFLLQFVNRGVNLAKPDNPSVNLAKPPTRGAKNIIFCQIAIAPELWFYKICLIVLVFVLWQTLHIAMSLCFLFDYFIKDYASSLWLVSIWFLIAF